MALEGASSIALLGSYQLPDLIGEASPSMPAYHWLAIRLQILRQRQYSIRSLSRLSSLIILGKNNFSHLAWVQTDRKSGGLGDLKYPLLSDVTKSIAKSYEVLIPDQGIALRGLFIIDKEGIIQHSTINNLAIGRSVDETLRTLQALQYVQENPDEVCPAGWKPGEKSMKPDPKLSKEYFAAI
ncbi:hypothetical protein HPP92_025788 [Vanilla planifolia]|uniref:thioredoxin-dependent peroxiredoxin n=1 Tax=Vanilla planifolia TaxID=51239 RepID=A0A835PFN1_VANPL|nr:hypothetical protein HPP92_025788 [Vanilla planifolia]